MSQELRALSNVLDKLVRRQDETLLDVSKTLVSLVLHDQSPSHDISRATLLLFYLNVNVALVEELPSESQFVISSTWSKHKVTDRLSKEMLKSLRAV